ncbi:MAG: beta-galactosidase [Bacteroidaceae bacterium]|nr:beta-galactosidase [Bacteroidaceae bacterium]
MRNRLLMLLACILLVAGNLSGKEKIETFEVGKGIFLLNGEPFVVKAAEVHYPRIPRPYWEHRIKMCKALGMNTLCLYVFWNIHEQRPGEFDFTGNNDIAAFCRLAQKHGMYVIVRPGPYVCAEWEMGGLPWWLLRKKDIRLREGDPYFLERVELFEKEVGKQLADLQLSRGGNIIMVQVENEYGSYGTDKEYVSQIRDIVRRAGFTDVPLFQCDWASNFTNNGLDDLLWTMNFGTGANIDKQFAKLKQLRPDSPLMCSEYWSGWFDKWGARHETRPAEAMVSGLREMLDKGISFSLYMTHGGTSFGHWAGANSPGFAPDVTSYDYDAPISESGRATPKYYQLRTMMAAYSSKRLPAVPREIPSMAVPASYFRFTGYAPIESGVDTTLFSRNIKTMEEMNMGWGSVLYTTTLPEIKTPSVLTLYDCHDYAQVFINGEFVGKIDRVLYEQSLPLPAVKAGDRLTILVEAMGRINFGRAIKDYKGITEKVVISTEVGGHETAYDLKNWSLSLLPDDYQHAKRALETARTDELKQGSLPLNRGYYLGYFDVKKTDDTFLDLSSWGKGQVYVNGHAIGRFWNIGPQQTLYVPGCWLKKGRNEVIVLDIVGPSKKEMQGLKEPILNQLNNVKPKTHRAKGEELDLQGETPVCTGEFAGGNGWQEVGFEKPVSGRYVCIEALGAHDGKELACIAELYLTDAQGERLSREGWTVRYADSEETGKGNRAADKLYDLQESTYWSTGRKSPYPHSVVIDLGGEYTLGGLQYLPRMEEGAPGSIKGYRIYVKSTPFKL